MMVVETLDSLVKTINAGCKEYNIQDCLRFLAGVDEWKRNRISY